MNLSIPSEFEAYNNAVYIAKSFPEISFPQEWKANILGTDLNLQFPANWNEAKGSNILLDIPSLLLKIL